MGAAFLSCDTLSIIMHYFHSLLTSRTEQQDAIPDSTLQQNTMNHVWHKGLSTAEHDTQFSVDIRLLYIKQAHKCQVYHSAEN